MSYMRQAKKGFTLIEIMIAITIVAIISVVGWQMTSRFLERGKRTAAQQALRNISVAIDSFNADTGQYPERLSDLVRRPADEAIAKKWQGPYIPKEGMLKDSWGNQYQYELTPGQEHSYELYSFGPKGRSAPQVERLGVWD